MRVQDEGRYAADCVCVLWNERKELAFRPEHRDLSCCQAMHESAGKE